MMTVFFNEEKVEIAKESTLFSFLQQIDTPFLNVVVAINRQFIPRACYTTTSLKENDRIDLITPMTGG